MSKLNLNESFISRIWERHQNYSGLKTTDGHAVEVIDLGRRNYDSGPDYIDAVISIDGRTYSGSVEIHRDSSDWNRHSHENDPNYAGVILHVAMFNEAPDENPAASSMERRIPTVILSEFLTRSLKDIWKELIFEDTTPSSILCYPKSLKADHDVKRKMICAQGMQRLSSKHAKIHQRAEALADAGKAKFAYEQTAFEYICEALGYSKNKKPFIRLSRNIDLEKMKAMKPGLTECDAVVFGMAGMLSPENQTDEYSNILHALWSEIRVRFRLPQLEASDWNFFRLRPPNFPTLRLAYASGLLRFILQNDLSEIVRDAFLLPGNPLKELKRFFRNIEVSDYWKQHYHFGRKKNFPQSILGDQRISEIIINVMIPFALALCRDEENSEELIGKIYLDVPASSSKSSMVRWLEQQTGFRATTANEEQGLLNLYENYCSKGRCISCRIGKLVFGEAAADEPYRIILY
ncbi:MAG: DUF2851 family protein [Ignavibacteria bacterium]|nr:DUF2851 family protein [Ignavibacteria bacterium]